MQCYDLKQLLYSNIGTALGKNFLVKTALGKNLSNHDLSNQEKHQLKRDWIVFTNKNKDVWRFLSANKTSLAGSVKDNFIIKIQTIFTYPSGYTDISTNNIYATKDYNYHNLCNMIQNKDIVVVKRVKYSSIVVMKNQMMQLNSSVIRQKGKS